MSNSRKVFTVKEFGDVIRDAAKSIPGSKYLADSSVTARHLWEEAERQEREGIPMPALPEVFDDLPSLPIFELDPVVDACEKSIGETPPPNSSTREIHEPVGTSSLESPTESDTPAIVLGVAYSLELGESTRLGVTSLDASPALDTDAAQTNSSLVIRSYRLVMEFERCGIVVRPPKGCGAVLIDDIDTSSTMLVQDGRSGFRTILIDAETRTDSDTLVASLGYENTPTSHFNSRMVYQFELRQHLGADWFGERWAAFDSRAQQLVELRLIRNDLIVNLDVIQQFRCNVLKVRNLERPNIISPYVAGLYGNTFFIAAKGPSWRSLRETCPVGGMVPSLAVRIVAELAQAVTQIHNIGSVHGDINPENILIDSTDRPHLFDFGLGSLPNTLPVTTPGTAIGSLAYIAPEHAGGRLVPASDQYSLGAVLYELLTGAPPFQGMADLVPSEKLHNIPPTPRAIRREIPHEVECICLRTMAREPEHRYPDCAALAAALQGWLNDQQLGA